jgi:hypothetical protein
MPRRFQLKANIPMVTETHRRLALELRLAGETLINRPSPDAYNQLSKMFAALARAGMAGDMMTLAVDTMTDVCDRYERVGKVGVNECEAEWLRTAIASIDGRLAMLPVNKFAQAVAEVEVFCATVGA